MVITLNGCKGNLAIIIYCTYIDYHKSQVKINLNRYVTIILKYFIFCFWQEEIFPKIQLYIEYLLFIWAAYMLK